MWAHAWLLFSFNFFSFKCQRTQRQFCDAQLWPVSYQRHTQNKFRLKELWWEFCLQIVSCYWPSLYVETRLCCRNSIDAVDDDDEDETSSIPSDEEGEVVFCGVFLVLFLFCLLLFVKENGKCLLLLRSVTTIWANIHTQSVVWWVSAHLFNLLPILLHVADAVHCAVRTFHITCHSRRTDRSFLFHLKKKKIIRRDCF